MPGSCYPAYPTTPPAPTPYPQPQYGNTPYPHQMPPTPLRPPPTPTQHYMSQASPPAVPVSYKSYLLNSMERLFF